MAEGHTHVFVSFKGIALHKIRVRRWKELGKVYIFNVDTISYQDECTADKDCKVDMNVTALTFSGNNVAKNVAEA